RMSIDASDYAFYDANELNQYSSIRKNEESAFAPTFDAAGNQTLVRTATGTWAVTYNAENRPVIFQKTADSVTTRITCTYDYMGRRATKKVEEITTDAEGNETTAIISNHRFIYRGYLQIGCCDLSRANHPCLWLITWDPTQPVATRPLAIQKDGTWYTYGWDLTKNICEIFGQNGYIRSTYVYSPFGSVTATGDVTQPIQWSSEYCDSDLALVYYNYRHYNPNDGRWINRDPIAEQGGWNLYGFLFNMSINSNDYIGKWKIVAKIPPSNKNTIITDGQGGIIPYLKAVRPKEKGCLLKCFEIHENVHIQDALNDFRKRKIIIPKKKNQLVVHSHFAELVLSEIKAYSCEISCLKQISGDKCKKIAQARVEHLEKGLIRFKKIGNLLIELVRAKEQKRPENELEIIRKKIKIEETYLRNDNYII
ncbi:MAG: RHS repeat-associated core domain-containing protein, partial [Akkermansia sp.]|nr:RHS repeat-associated core domain-containing protein [Akkermansia sp.]